jgi:hypothetical protein
MTSRSRSKHGVAGIALLLGFGAALPADAQSSILHELLPPDPTEDVAFATTTLDGDLPAAIQTSSGVATAPDLAKPTAASDHIYGGATTDDSPDARYEPDRDTRRPSVEAYDDPFTPATAPFKRLRAYDAVEDGYSLRVRDRSLRPIAIGGSLGAGDEPFYGDLTVDLVAGEPVRIPTVGPGMRVLRMHVSPAVPIELFHDAADNAFVRSSTRARVRLVMQLAIARASFGSEFADVTWAELDRHARPEPSRHRAAFDHVAGAIGISRSLSPREVVGKMVGYFRDFAPSDEAPRGHDDIYLDLALSKKGVCRHRSFAFLVTALNIGIPARMVVNEAHAWVEVFDGLLWHRIDLGGAAANLQNDVDPSRPPYAPPLDPYGWPAGRDSGQDLAERARKTQAQVTSPAQGSTPPSSTPSPSGSTGSPPSSSEPPPAERPPPLDVRPPAEFRVDLPLNEARRGRPLHLSGRVGSTAGACSNVRVDVGLVGSSSPMRITLGSLSTDDRGDFSGAVVVPRDFTLGDYELRVSTPGDARCGPANQ